MDIDTYPFLWIERQIDIDIHTGRKKKGGGSGEREERRQHLAEDRSPWKRWPEAPEVTLAIGFYFLLEAWPQGCIENQGLCCWQKED